jgi:hypothetical protein
MFSVLFVWCIFYASLSASARSLTLTAALAACAAVVLTGSPQYTLGFYFVLGGVVVGELVSKLLGGGRDVA